MLDAAYKQLDLAVFNGNIPYGTLFEQSVL